MDTRPALIVLLLQSVLAASAQSPTETPLAATQAIQRMVAGVEKTITGVATEMPEDKYGFVPTDGAFRGVQNFAEQIRTEVGCGPRGQGCARNSCMSRLAGSMTSSCWHHTRSSRRRFVLDARASGRQNPSEPVIADSLYTRTEFGSSWARRIPYSEGGARSA
jgi:hypothetical protein